MAHEIVGILWTTYVQYLDSSSCAVWWKCHLFKVNFLVDKNILDECLTAFKLEI